MNNKDLISVVIPTYGRTECLKHAINSVIYQSYKNVEIVVVDDNDSDSEEHAIVKEIITEYVKMDNFKYISLDRNSGGSIARNTGIAQAKGEYIAFLDDDDIYLPEYLECMLNELQNGDYDVVYAAQYYELAGRTAIASKKRLPKVSGNIWNHVLAADIPISIFLLFNKKCVECLGGFDANVKAYDDYDLWLRWSRKLNFGCMNIPLTIVRREFGKSLTCNVEKMRAGLNMISCKWSPLLTEEERTLFADFIYKHERGIAKNELYILKINDEVAFRIKYKEYIKKYNLSYMDRIKLWAQLQPRSEGDLLRQFKRSIFRFRYNILKIN